MRLKINPLDEGFNSDNVITNPIAVNKKDRTFTPDGIFSEKVFGKLMSSGRDYSCECGDMQGSFFKGMFCVKCDTAVSRRDSMFSKRGWIDLGEYSIIHPMIYQYLVKAFKKDNLVQILAGKHKYDSDGIMMENDTRRTSSKYHCIGMQKFKENFDEIFDYFRNTSNDVTEPFFNIIEEHRSLIFSSKIPIFNHILRPAIMQRDLFSFDEVNNIFNLVINFNKQLQELTTEERTPVRIDALLWNIQEKVNEIMEDVLTKLSGKFGYLRTKLLGTRINFSARSVITPLSSGHDLDEIHVPYLTFLELFRFQIISTIANTHKISLLEADERWARAQSKRDDFIFNLCEEMIRRQNGWPCLLNRNPSIAFGSILLVRITKIKDNLDDYTFSLNNNILRLIGGDYDGDEVNICPLFDKKVVENFSIFNPKYMAIDRSTLGFNTALEISKDHLLGLTILTEDPPSIGN